MNKNDTKLKLGFNEDTAITNYFFLQISEIERLKKLFVPWFR